MQIHDIRYGAQPNNRAGKAGNSWFSQQSQFGYVEALFIVWLDSDWQVVGQYRFYGGLLMNRREHNKDPRRGLPNVAEQRKTNMPLENGERAHSEREAIERPVRVLDDNRPAR